MADDSVNQGERSFSPTIIVISFIFWIIPILIISLLPARIVNNSPRLWISVLIISTLLIPFLAYALYRIDEKRANGYVTIWGVR